MMAQSATQGLVAIQPFGSLWTCGLGSSGRLGNGSLTTQSSPVQVGALTVWRSVSLGGGPGGAIKIDGTLWTWGAGANGGTWQGGTANTSSPVQVGSLNVWKYYVAGPSLAFAIQTDGTLWAGGVNRSGVLGLGDTTSRSSPVQVGALTDWKMVAPAYESAYAVKTDGTLWCWGAGRLGQLGLGSTTDYSSPVQIGSDTDWLWVVAGTRAAVGAACSVMAIKKNGTIFTWGDNAFGQLGLGDTTARSSPVQVGALTDWRPANRSGVNGGSVKLNGTLWTWGGVPGLGDGTATAKSSPIQVGALTDWSQGVAFGGTNASGAGSALSLKKNGTIWSWGLNSAGELALGDTTDRSSPVQITSRCVAIMTSGLANNSAFILGP